MSLSLLTGRTVSFRYFRILTVRMKMSKYVERVGRALYSCTRIRISDSLPWDRKYYLTHAILPGRQVTSSCEIAS